MCTLAVYFRVSRDYPLVVAANRDEYYARPALPPAALGESPWVIGGRDSVGGGTWLGVNAAHVVAGILNRRRATAPDPSLRSRGLLCLETLESGAVAAAVAGVTAQPGARYNPFNLLIASPDEAHVVGNVSGNMQSTGLAPGLHLLTNLDLNDPTCPRIAKSHRRFAAAQRHLDEGDIDALRTALHRILSDHSTQLDPRAPEIANNLCVHGEHFGTRSSTLLLYIAAARRFRLWHAEGPPCTHPYIEVALPQSSVDKPAETE